MKRIRNRKDGSNPIKDNEGDDDGLLIFLIKKGRDKQLCGNQCRDDGSKRNFKRDVVRHPEQVGKTKKESEPGAVPRSNGKDLKTKTRCAE
ncbi:MAG: hypothetical protein AAF724_00765 [Pseudomonadota bacterium]